MAGSLHQVSCPLGRWAFCALAKTAFVCYLSSDSHQFPVQLSLVNVIHQLHELLLKLILKAHIVLDDERLLQVPVNNLQRPPVGEEAVWKLQYPFLFVKAPNLDPRTCLWTAGCMDDGGVCIALRTDDLQLHQCYSGSSLAGWCLSYATVRGHSKEGTKTGRTMLSDVRMVIALGGRVTRRLCRGEHLRHVWHLFLDASNY